MSSLRHVSIVSTLTGLSRAMGLLREVAMASMFGTSLAKSAFDVAFRIPNLFRAIFGEGALSAAFVPVFTETLHQDGRDAANRLAGRVATLLGSCLIMITMAAIITITIALRFVASGSRPAAVLPLLRIMFPFMIFICLVALCMGILNSIGCFAVPAAAPVILNIIWIAAILVVCPRLGTTPAERIYGVAWAVLIAGVIELAAQLPALRKHCVWPVFSFQWNDPRIARIILLLGPAALGMGVHQINVVIDGFLALWIGTWAPAALTYADRLVYLPLGLFTTALATVLLPAFSRHTANGQAREIPGMLANSVMGLLLIITPAAIGMAVMATPIVRLVFEYGHFDAHSTLLTSRALLFYAPGLLVFSLVKLLVPVFYALKDTRTPLQVGISAVGLNLVLNIVFIWQFPDGYKHAGLALATVIASGVNATALGILATRRVGSPGWRRIGFFFARVLACSLVMATAIHQLLRGISGIPVFSPETLAGKLLTLVAAIAVAVPVYATGIAVFCRHECLALIRSRR